MINICMQKSKWIFLTVSLVLAVLYIPACKKDNLTGIDNVAELLPLLSDYQIFQGNASDLNPATGFLLYELSSPLFSDYAEKQRLLKLPAGKKMLANDNGLPDFPEGTILVKTFYYYHDKRDITKGKIIIETRLLIKSVHSWNVGTYLWNEEQTDARLVTAGLNKTVNWISENGKPMVISYHVPANRECTSCHHSENTIVPIGPKIRNLNRDIIRNGVPVNQLSYLQHEKKLDTLVPSSFEQLPNWEDESQTLDKRARAYLDVNCAHCHNKHGFAAQSNVYFDYGLSFQETKIADKKTGIINILTKGDMPKLGTTLIDKEGLALVKTYVESLK